MATSATFRSTFESDSKPAQTDQQKFSDALGKTEKAAEELGRQLRDSKGRFIKHGESARRAAKDQKKFGDSAKKSAKATRDAEAAIV